MTEPKPTDCIYCGAPAGSAEHTVLAALGGLRTDRGILCGTCNRGFGETIDRVLAEDMKPINAIVGVMNGRTRDPIATIAKDAATGRSFVLTNGRRLEHPDAVVVSDSTRDGVRSIWAVASSQKQADDLVHRLKQEGKGTTVTSREVIPHLFASTPTVQWNFGGTDTFRCVARLVVNILASFRPGLARGEWLVPLKRFIREGGDHEPWVNYAYGLSPAPPFRFDFAHRFSITFDAVLGDVRAHVSLLGVMELSVRLGTATIAETETITYEMDVLAQSPPDDIVVTMFPGTVALPAVCTEDPSVHVPERLARLLAKRDERVWAQDAPKLLASINAARDVEPFDQHDVVVEALASQRQRLLNLASLVARRIRRHVTTTVGDAEGASVGDAFDLLVAPDGSSRTGVTDLTQVHAEMLCNVMADHIVDVLRERQIESDELRLLLEGSRGTAIVGRFMLEQLQEGGHPLLIE